MTSRHASSFQVLVDGTSLEACEIAGSRPELSPLVFLHEGLGCVDMWGAQGRYWPEELCAATGRRGLVYSRPGYGQSDPIVDVRGAGRHRPDYMHREALQRLPALLRTLGVQQPVLIGHSDGATIALLHAAHHTVSACVAMAPHVWVEAVAIRSIEQARRAYETMGLRERLSRVHRDVDNAFWQWNDIWLSDAFRRFDVRQECRRIRSPLLLVQGLNDEYGTLAQLDEIVTAVPHATRLELPDCGHSPHRDQPALLTQALRDWLKPLP